MESHSNPNPYQPKPGFKARYTASCHCGGVTYQISRQDPLDSKFCHCTGCQVIHGSPCQWAAIFHKLDLNFPNGSQHLGFYDHSQNKEERQLPCKVRCVICHSFILDEGRNMFLIFPSLVKFESKEDKERFLPRCHIFYKQRVIDIKDGRTKWEGLDHKSLQMGDV
ncbi:hypothetical protein K470DRAFT_300087 [Piedraia hortae CBS 480.64]|uniref:CENP-V/GFA domain-containing protein n=1 Tax=Piedraia hortae CBS 480.64 TaxID=1314780 RepID=A0A6A7BYM4_9PEZI|nr:hypothetical protein K470DRAFT_300087 [Piedraia hortae CBS 480.64]